ncbi:MAG: InlB B-repeat-containing protein [Oscillospiraceae bacterium]|nr:InlB B-repeat-containing protein [Oscillospiraceae bacterium]
MKIKNSTLRKILSFILVFALTAGILPAFPVSADAFMPEISYINDIITDAQMSAVRDEFFGSSSDDAAGLQVVEIDKSRIIHEPQIYRERQPESGLLMSSVSYNTAPVSTNAGPFNVGDRRNFRARVGAANTSNEWRVVAADLIGQGEHTNIWVVDCSFMHGSVCYVLNCNQKSITRTLAQEIAGQVDEIYKMMTADFGEHAGVQINTRWNNEPVVGDIAGDGKVNYLFYDINNDGGSSGGYTLGFFTNGDFFTYLGNQPMNNIDMLHIDIGTNQGFNSLKSGATDEEKYVLYDTLAHELQHLLFYMHFGVYLPNSMVTGRTFSWFNESLSELAGTYYVQQGFEITSFGRLLDASENEYWGSGYGDFISFNNSFKNYGMSRLFGMLMYKRYGSGFVSGVYNNFRATYPPSRNSTQYTANENRITNAGHDLTVGRALRAGTGVGTDANALQTLYFLFMENFAADGGLINPNSTTPTQSTKFNSTSRPVDNLWAIRPVMGTWGGRVYHEIIGSGYFNSVNNYDLVPSLGSGGYIMLYGYGTQPPERGASHDMLYKLSGSGNESSPILTITAPVDGNDALRYYVAVPKDTLVTGSYRASSGHQGADLYPLTKGVPARINTNGQEAYLFVATFNSNVFRAGPSFSWSAAGANELTGRVTLSPERPRLGQAITAVVSIPDAFDYKWTSDGEEVGVNSNTYTPTISDIGKVIRLEVTVAGKTGIISAQTARVGKEAGPPKPVQPYAFAVSNTRVILDEAPGAGYEYSRNGLFWQDSAEFSALLPDTSYTFYQRLKATATQDTSVRSDGFTVKTSAAPEMIFYVSSSEQLTRALAYNNDSSIITFTNNVTHTSDIIITGKKVTLALGVNNLTVPNLMVDSGELITTGTGTITGNVFGARGGIVNGMTWVTLSYDSNGGEGQIPEEHSPVGENVIAANPEGILSREGYAFSGWNTAADGSGTGYAEGDTFNFIGNVTLFAQWQCIHAHWGPSGADCTKCSNCGADNGIVHVIDIEVNCTQCVNCEVFRIAPTCPEENPCTFCSCEHENQTTTRTLAPGCLTEGADTITCDDCDGTLDKVAVPARGHLWNSGVITTPATPTAAGVRTFTCTDCPAARTEAIPATGNSKSTGGGGGGGGGGSTDASVSSANIIQSGTGTMIPNFAISRAMINLVAGTLPVFQLRVTEGGTHVVTTGASRAGQNAILVRINATTNQLEVVNSVIVSSNGSARISIARNGDYIVLIRRTGDITGTGEVGTADALALLRHIAGISELNAVQLFTANGKTGDTGTTEALNILRFVAGVIDKI